MLSFSPLVGCFHLHAPDDSGSIIGRKAADAYGPEIISAIRSPIIGSLMQMSPPEL